MGLFFSPVGNIDIKLSRMKEKVRAHGVQEKRRKILSTPDKLEKLLPASESLEGPENYQCWAS